MRKMKLKLIAAALSVGCGLGAFALRRVVATPPTPPPGFVASNIIGPVSLEPIDTKSQPPWAPDCILISVIQKSENPLVRSSALWPSTWHSHPGTSIIAVKSGHEVARSRTRA
jgi:hypothetical protein